MRCLEKILDLMETKGMISSIEERTVRRYGLELLFNGAANTTGLLIQGFLLGRPLHVIIFYCTYLFFKIDTGGYHARSHLACILQFNLACFLLLTSYQYGYFALYKLGILILLLICVFLFAPVVSHMKQLSKEQQKLHRSRARRKSIITVLLLIMGQIAKIRFMMIDYLYLGLLLTEITVLMGAAQNLYEKARVSRYV